MLPGPGPARRASGGCPEPGGDPGGCRNGGSGRRPTRAAGRTCLVNRPERAHPGGQPYSFSACSHSRLYASCSARRARSFASRYSSTKRTFRRVEDVGTSAIAQRVDSAAQGVGPRTGRSPESTRKACAALGSKRSPRLRQPVGGARPPSSLGRRDLTHGRPGRILPPTATGASAPSAPARATSGRRRRLRGPAARRRRRDHRHHVARGVIPSSDTQNCSVCLPVARSRQNRMPAPILKSERTRRHSARAKPDRWIRWTLHLWRR